MMKNILTCIILLIVISGCAGLKKTETSGIITSASVNSVSWLWKVMPGYRSRTLRRHDFNIELQEKKLRLDELRYDRRDARFKYSKLTMVNEKKDGK